MSSKPVIHVLWVKEPIPLLVKLCLNSMVATGNTVKLYSYSTLDVDSSIELVDANEVIPEDLIFTYQNGVEKGSLAAFANLFRYKVLYKYGGWWLDADIFCIRPLQFTEPYIITYEAGGKSQIHNGVFKAPPDSLFMRRLAEEATKVNPASMQWGETGSRLCTRLLKGEFKHLQRYCIASEVFCPIPWDVVLAYLSRGLPRLPQTTVGIHLFHEVWRRAGIDLDNPNVLYEWLGSL